MGFEQEDVHEDPCGGAFKCVCLLLDYQSTTSLKVTTIEKPEPLGGLPAPVCMVSPSVTLLH